MFSLTRDPKDELFFQERLFSLTLSFDRVLMAFELLEDRDFSEWEKVPLLLSLFIQGSSWKRLDGQAQLALLGEIFEKRINIDPRMKDNSAPRSLDLVADAPYIFASFRSAYGIDLHAERGRMSWPCFYWLLDGLPDGCKLREVMQIRQADMPPPSPYNIKEREALQKAKQYYALRASGMDVQSGIAKIFEIGKALAGGVKNER